MIKKILTAGLLLSFGTISSLSANTTSTGYGYSNSLPILSIEGRVIESRSLNKNVTDVVISNNQYDINNGVYFTLRVVDKKNPYKYFERGSILKVHGSVKGRGSVLGDRGDVFEYNSNSHLMRTTVYTLTKPVIVNDMQVFQPNPLSNIVLEGQLMSIIKDTDDQYSLVLFNDNNVDIKDSNGNIKYTRAQGAVYKVKIKRSEVPAFDTFIAENEGYLNDLKGLPFKIGGFFSPDFYDKVSSYIPQDHTIKATSFEFLDIQQ